MDGNIICISIIQCNPHRILDHSTSIMDTFSCYKYKGKKLRQIITNKIPQTTNQEASEQIVPKVEAQGKKLDAPKGYKMGGGLGQKS